MWTFKGVYTGTAKDYIQEKKKKEVTVWALVSSILIAVIFLVMAIFLGDGNTTYIIIILCGGFWSIIFVDLVLFIYFKCAPKCQIEITNDGIQFIESGTTCSLPFYKIDPIEYHDDFIVLCNKLVLQKELLVQGDWVELKILLKKVEESLATDNPMYQIEEPETQFVEATVKEKRIYQKFITGVSVTTPVGLFQYFATFQLENDEEVEYEIGQQWYEKIEKAQTGQLVLINGNFFSFGEGEDIE